MVFLQYHLLKGKKNEDLMIIITSFHISITNTNMHLPANACSVYFLDQGILGPWIPNYLSTLEKPTS